MHDEKDVIQCFTNMNIQTIIFGYLGIAKRDFQFKRIRDMKVNQDGLVFKLYETPSETQPVIITDKEMKPKRFRMFMCIVS